MRCKCLSYNRPRFRQTDPEVVLDTPDGYSRKTICIDACMVEGILDLWYFGVVTENSCCRHNEAYPEVIIHEDEDLVAVLELLKSIGYGDWVVGQWRLIWSDRLQKQSDGTFGQILLF